MTLDEGRDHIGHGVVYRPMVGPAEDGVISSVSSLVVFVRYASGHPQATCAHDLELLAATAALQEETR